ncbi:MAG TPA: DinB family protein [Pyrinomonadaceae bacterium]|nr:DinB family protein [Pyrinomonadaceae bacterium]
MNEVEKIEDQLRRAFEGEAWYGDSLDEILAGVTAEQAAARPIHQVHSVIEIILHLAFTEDVMRRRIEGEDAGFSEGEDLFYVEEASEDAWMDAKAKLKASHRKLIEVVHSLKEEDLERNVIGRNHSIYFLLHGLIQHQVYHAGQIAVLKKAQM